MTTHELPALSALATDLLDNLIVVIQTQYPTVVLDCAAEIVILDLIAEVLKDAQALK